MATTAAITTISSSRNLLPPGGNSVRWTHCCEASCLVSFVTRNRSTLSSTHPQNKSSKVMKRSNIVAELETEVDTQDPDMRVGVPVYRPSSYDVLVSDATKALEIALDENKLRLEIDFPPLPSSISGYKGSSDEFIDANIQLVLALVRKLYERRGIASRIVFPDKTEKRRASRIFKSALEFTKGVSFGSLDDVPGGAGNTFFKSMKNALDFDFEEDDEGKWQNRDAPSLYIFINCSTSELPAVETYVDKLAGKLPAVLFNLELDTLRADLGLFGFPSKEMHYRFLSQFLPVFYIRTRDYSKSIAVAPFVLDYSGALFRIYPGPWQVMLKQGDGSYVCVAETSDRFTLGQAKEELMTALGLQEEAGSAMSFLRRGFKNSTWWEDDVNFEKSSAWRS